MVERVGRAEWLIEHLTLVPGIVEDLRAQISPSRVQRFEGRVSGSSDRAALPFRVDVFDALDELWAVLWEMVDFLVEATPSLCFCFLREVQALRALQPMMDRPAPNTVRGYRSTSPSVISHETYRVVHWLIDHAWRLALGSEFDDGVDALVERIDGLYRVSGRAAFRSYRSQPCGLCGHRAVRAEWREDGSGLAAWVCDDCEYREDPSRPRGR